jgi:hypothetical protein
LYDYVLLDHKAVSTREHTTAETGTISERMGEMETDESEGEEKQKRTNQEGGIKLYAHIKFLPGGG